MADKRTKLLNVFENLLPKLSDYDLDKLICFGEGIAFKVNELEKKTVEENSKGA